MQLKSAVTAVSKARGNRGEYIEPCVECMRKDSAQIYTPYIGCMFHQGMPKLYRRGDPELTETFEHSVKRFLTERKGNKKGPRGSSALTPWELYLRSYLVSTNYIWDYQMWVILLITCKLGCRAQDILKFNLGGLGYPAAHGQPKIDFPTVNHRVSIVNSQGIHVLNMNIRFIKITLRMG